MIYIKLFVNKLQNSFLNFNIDFFNSFTEIVRKKLSKMERKNRNAEDMLKQFSETLSRHIKEPEDLSLFINSILEYSEFISEISYWNKSWIHSISEMREIINRHGSKELSDKFTTLSDTFVEAMILGLNYRKVSQLLYEMKPQLDLLTDVL